MVDTVIKTKFDWANGTMGAYILYDHITTKQRNGDSYKFMFFDIDSPEGTLNEQRKNHIFALSDYRESYVAYLKKAYPKSYSSDNGISAMIDAINCNHENLICLYKNKKLVGALSYTIYRKSKKIDIGHIGCIERNIGNGTMLMIEVFKLAKIFNYDVTVTSNGYADNFYTKLYMKHVSKQPSLFKLSSKYIQETNYEGRNHNL